VSAAFISALQRGKHGKLTGRFSRHVSLVLITCVLFGCSAPPGYDHPMFNTASIRIRRPTVSAARSLRNNDIQVGYDPQRVGLDNNQPVAVSGLPSAGLHNEQPMSYYTAICDVYWKLNWIRKELRQGTVPYNMLDEIHKNRVTLERVTRCGNYDLAAEAMDRLENGLAHLACLRTMRAAHIDVRHMPWEADQQSAKELLDLDHRADVPASALRLSHRSTGEDDDDEPIMSVTRPIVGEPTSDPAHSLAVSLTLDYQNRYHRSPQQLMQEEWESAIRKINRLRDNLALQNREQNSDGDGADVSIAVTRAMDGGDIIHVPVDAGRSGRAPSMVAPRT